MRFPFVSAALLLLAELSCGLSLQAQHLPPMIGNEVGKPKISFPNPLEGGSQSTGQASQNQAIKNQESELHAFLEGYSACFSNNNPEKLAQYYWQGPELSVYWNFQEFHGWDKFGGQLQKILASPGIGGFSLVNSDIHLLGRLAWIASGYRIEKTDQNKTGDLQGQLTLILERKRNIWYIVHQHISGIDPH